MGNICSLCLPAPGFLSAPYTQPIFPFSRQTWPCQQARCSRWSGWFSDCIGCPGLKVQSALKHQQHCVVALHTEAWHWKEKGGGIHYRVPGGPGWDLEAWPLLLPLPLELSHRILQGPISLFDTGLDTCGIIVKTSTGGHPVCSPAVAHSLLQYMC